ncbi:MAG: DNA polymerase-3 subunit gamma/tau [Woeseiaceae bacterium]|jgi:DNA polymerase-3 subunit gamma/tau
MSYLVLARKWRPKNFAETVGQEHVLQALSNALESGRLHHAYLFAGTRGVGKTTIARILAKALNCDTGVTSAPCGECSACHEIDEGRFVDLIEVDAASKTKVDDTRELLDNVQYAPARGRFKVYLIDEVHMLSKSSFNALLKTLEEPPPHVKFLLATTDPQKLPVTVLSRCLQFNLKRLTPKLIRDRLELICNEEKIEFDMPALAMLARSADGSLRDALSLLDQAIAYCGGKVSEEAVGVMLGTIDGQYVNRILRLLSAGDAGGVIAAIAEIDEQFPDYARLLDDLARILQRIAVYQVIGATNGDDDIDEAELATLASGFAAEDVQLFYQTALIGRRDLHLAPDPRSGAEMTLLRMLAFQPGGSGQRQIADNADAEKVSAALRATPVAKTGNAQASAVGHEWQEPDWSVLIDDLDLNGANKLLASNCAYIGRDGNVINLGLDARSESLLTGPRQAAIAASLTGHFGEKLRINITIAIGDVQKETPIQEEERRSDEKMAAARSALEADPNVQALQEMFGAELKPESIEILSNQSAATQE